MSAYSRPRQPANRKFDRRAIAFVATSCIFLLAGCGGSSPTTASPTLDKGKAHFGRICATCHGADAMGLPSLGKALVDNAFTKSQSDAELVAFLKMGRSAGDPLNETGVDMPPKGGDPTMTDDDLVAIVAYLRTL